MGSDVVTNLGLQAWRRRERRPADTSLHRLVAELVPNPAELGPLTAFIDAADLKGLTRADGRYQRAVLAADKATSDVISNDDPEEVRYNIFQALQYITDWLGGNGCVALPASLTNRSGQKVFIRVMDDLATTERSRWELWAEVHHCRVPVTVFETLLAQEADFIRCGVNNDVKRIQVQWQGDAARWYPVAINILRVLACSLEPPEFASELMLPFTLDFIRNAADPWAEAVRYAPSKLVPAMHRDAKL